MIEFPTKEIAEAIKNHECKSWSVDGITVDVNCIPSPFPCRQMTIYIGKLAMRMEIDHIFADDNEGMIMSDRHDGVISLRY